MPDGRRCPGGLHGAVRGAALAESADDLVHLRGGLAGELLDVLKRPARAPRILVMAQPRRAGLDGNDADRVPSRVVQVARDAGALLSGGEVTLALGVAVRVLPERVAAARNHRRNRRCHTRRGGHGRLRDHPGPARRRPRLALAGGVAAAVTIGAVAGLYPSLRAARLSPTEALRTV